MHNVIRYDQTNVDFYQVTKVLEKSVEVREIGAKVVKAEHTDELVVPIPNSFKGSPMTKLVGMGGYIKIDSSQYASKWDGKPERQTAWGYGH